MRDVLLEGERLDDLQNGYCLIQDPQKFCFGMDAVLLSGFARVRPEEKVLDMCLLAWRYRKCVLIWPGEVFLTIIWKKKFGL